MAISDAIGANAGAVAPAAPQPKASGKDGGKAEAFRKTGVAERAKMSEDQKAVEGSKSDKVEFICALGDPNRKQNRTEANTSKESYYVVGYKFKVLEDMTVPQANIKEDWKALTDTDPISEVSVKAGTVVSLNLIETADLISRVEFAGRFTGGSTPVQLTAKVSQDRTDPLPVLKKVGTGSIKENMELIADMIGGDGENKGKPQIKAEFADKFSVLYRKKESLRKSTGAGAVSGEAQKNLAAAFRHLYASRRA